MKLKLDEKGNVSVSDGKPVYIFDDGREVAFDAKTTTDTIQNLKHDADENKTKLSSLQSLLDKNKDYDFDAANAAVEKLKNIDDKTLLDAEGVESLKNQFATNYAKETQDLIAQSAKQKADSDEALKISESKIAELHIGHGFGLSDFIKKNVLISPADAIRLWGDNFKYEQVGENLQLVGYQKGQKIYSVETAGEVAGFDEAFEKIFNSDPSSDRYRLSSQNGGSGGFGGGKDTIDTSGMSGKEKLRHVRRT